MTEPDPSADDYTWLTTRPQFYRALLSQYCAICGQDTEIYQRGIDGVIALCLTCAGMPGGIRLNRLIQAVYGLMEILPAPDERALAVLGALTRDLTEYTRAGHRRLLGEPPEPPAGRTATGGEALKRSRLQRWWGDRPLPERPTTVSAEDWRLFVRHVRDHVTYAELGRSHGRASTWVSERLARIQVTLQEGYRDRT